jgi:ribonuclease Y
VDSIASAPSSISYGYVDNAVYNAAYDIWLDPTPRTDGVNRTEVMIWFHRTGPVQPIGSPVGTATVGGLLHDIGKALTHEVSGPHAEIGAELAKKYGINYGSYRGILEHHSDEHETVESFLVATADAISAARPGARKESLEHYVKRLRDLEEVASGFPGVERTFAIQAGREVRVMVNPSDLDDVSAAALARDIARKVEQDLVFPGQIKVTVIRETRTVDYAR